MINFAKGHPNRKLLPLKEIQDIFSKVSLDTNDDNLSEALNYPKRDAINPPLLKELKAFLDRYTKDDEIGQDLTSGQHQEPSFFMTHGVSHALEILCRTQTAPGDVVLMERPTYFLAAGIFKSLGLQIQSLPMKETGAVDLESLESSFKNGTMAPPRIIYVIPTHQNPTGSVMSIQDRTNLARLAREYGILVIADEVYHLLDWRSPSCDGPRPARMAVVDSYQTHIQGKQLQSPHPYGQHGCSVTVSSFTKIFAPGVRCGWVEGPEHIVRSLENLGYIQSQGGCTPLIGELMRCSLSQGIGDRVLDGLTAAFRMRSQRLCQILSSVAGIRLHTKPLGGYFVWATFDGIDDTSDFLSYCSDCGVKFLPGERCDLSSGEDGPSNSSCRQWARFCFADLDMEDIEKGATKVVELYQSYICENKK